MSQLQKIIEKSPYWDLLVVCQDGSVRQNKALLVVVFPFLLPYSSILDTNMDNATIFLPDFTMNDILSAVRKPFSKDKTMLPDFSQQDAGTVSSKKAAGKTSMCNLCGKIVLKVSLSSHKRLHNTTKYSCKICMKKFVRETQLKIHFRKHTGEMPYSCDISGCGKKFSTRQGKETHQKICSKEKAQFTCVECNRGFYTEYKLKLHSLVHTGKKDFPCLACGKLFSRKDNLKTHMNRFCIANKIQNT